MNEVKGLKTVPRCLRIRGTPLVSIGVLGEILRFPPFGARLATGGAQNDTAPMDIGTVSIIGFRIVSLTPARLWRGIRPSDGTPFGRCCYPPESL